MKWIKLIIKSYITFCMIGRRYDAAMMFSAFHDYAMGYYTSRQNDFGV